MSIEPVIIPRSGHAISRKWISPNALRVLYRLKETGHHAYLVGGGVRDLLLGREPKDFDIATDATPNEVKKIFRNCRLIGKRFRLAHVHFHDEIIEVATFRALASEVPVEETAALEAAPAPEQPAPARPEETDLQELSPSSASLAVKTDVPEIVPPGVPPAGAAARPRPPRLLKTEDGMILRDNVWGSAEEDALRRDFTVNALFYNIADFSVIDYVGGMEDLRRGMIRIIGDPVVRFTEDPVRMVRAVRFAALLGFQIEETTERALLDLKERIALASPARMYEEVLKLFLQGEAEKTFQLLRKTGMFAVLFPGLNEWLDTELEGFPHTWVGKALEWVDTYALAGRKVEPQVLFSLMAGQYIEEKAGVFRNQGTAALEALDKAVAEFLAEHIPRVQIPRKVALIVRDILWNQARFAKTAGKVPFYFIRRPGFADAYEYFRFTSELTGERMELRAWWRDFLKVHPPEPVEEKPERKDHRKKDHGKKEHAKKEPGKPERPQRRRRRSRGPRRPEGQQPKT